MEGGLLLISVQMIVPGEHNSDSTPTYWTSLSKTGVWSFGTIVLVYLERRRQLGGCV